MTASSVKYDAVFYEAFEEEEKELGKVLPADRTYLFTWKTIQESGHSTPPGDLISTRTQSIFPFEWADKLNGIITRSTGYDHVSEYLSKTNADIAAAYLPDYAARAVAEQALMMWSSLLRNLSFQREALKSFNRDGLTGREISGKMIAVLGVGRIGSQIVDIAHGLKMKILGVDIKPDLSLVDSHGIEYVSLTEALRAADIVVCALPLTDITRGMLDYGVLSYVKKGAIFINIARGEISPCADLLKLLEDGTLSGVGLDVYDCERDMAFVLRDNGALSDLPGERCASVEAAMKLMNDPRALLTPHNAFNTLESVERKSLRTAENLSSYFDCGRFISPVPEK
jgi:D-lactate dehydrogenase